MYLAILSSLILWPLYIALELVLQVVGLVLLAILSACHAWIATDSGVYQIDGTSICPEWGLFGCRLHPDAMPRRITRWRGSTLTWIWGNEEDGVTGPIWWQERTGAARYGRLNCAWSAYRWSALRNPCNNLRFVPVLNPVIEPSRIGCAQHAIGHSFWTFTWQGLYAGLMGIVQFRGQTFRFWLGWKLKPHDAYGVPDDDMRKPRCGFAMQFKRV